ncbi:MAG: hypothetical protein K9L17_06670 [Clostridiales bacterium]|nr:hypothetical protein [Clostridiales bacterium]MCF8022356.1 hypothetical protein [Clostridiales bacterium]
MDREGKVKSNYLKLVESIASTIVKEDLIKNSAENERDQKRKEFIQSLYMT